MSGKGDTPRPLSVPADDFAARWEQTFGSPAPRHIERTGSVFGVPIYTDTAVPPGEVRVVILRETPPEP